MQKIWRERSCERILGHLGHGPVEKSNKYRVGALVNPTGYSNWRQEDPSKASAEAFGKRGFLRLLEASENLLGPIQMYLRGIYLGSH